MQIYMWGIGGSAAKIIERYLPLDRIAGFVTSHKTDSVSSEFMGKHIYTPDEMTSREYDAIVVSSVYVENIYADCCNAGLDMNKIVFLRRTMASEGTINCDLLRKIFGEKDSETIRRGCHVITSTELDEYEDSPCLGYRNDGMFTVDYVRVRTLEFICGLIQSYGIAGSIAELGVFRGDFSYYISRLLPKRKFYLFDTFEGFANQEATKEIQSGNITAVTVGAYKNTSVEIVKDRLEGKERVEVRKGYFPETLNGLEDTFAFVSLDVDLEESIYNGLVYFYPRMQKGGYIMVHDYNSLFKGVRDAVEHYEKDQDILLMKVPLCDSAGTLVIVKG